MTADDAKRLAEVQRRSYERAGTSLRSSWPERDAFDETGLAEFLARKDYAVLATATAGGRPQAAPIAFFVRDGAFWIATVAGGRLRNLRENPHAALVIEEGDRGAHRALRVEGDVVVHEPSEELREAWRQRHGGDAGWAAAFLELRPRTLFSYAES